MERCRKVESHLVRQTDRVHSYTREGRDDYERKILSVRTEGNFSMVAIPLGGAPEVHDESEMYLTK